MNLEELLARGSELEDDASLKAWLRELALAVERDPALAMLLRLLSDMPSIQAAGYADDLVMLVHELHASPSWRGTNGPQIALAVSAALRAFAEPDVS